MPWRPARFKGTAVHVECDEAGEPVVQDGRVSMRYRIDDARTYRAALHNVKLLDGAGGPPASPRKARARPEAPVPAAALPQGGLLPAGRLRAPAEEPIVVYTDGACLGNPGPAGLGVVVVDAGRTYELSHYLGEGTNNVAELSAIGEAARALAGSTRPVRIHTDSQYSIGVLAKGWKAKANRALVAQVKTALDALPRVELIYVRGHAGIELNERADALAVAAASSEGSVDWS